MGDHIIIGDTEQQKDCLICVCFAADNAERVLYRMLTNPSDHDKKIIKGYYNLRIKEVPIEDCWWRGKEN